MLSEVLYSKKDSFNKEQKMINGWAPCKVVNSNVLPPREIQSEVEFLGAVQ